MDSDGNLPDFHPWSSPTHSEERDESAAESEDTMEEKNEEEEHDPRIHRVSTTKNCTAIGAQKISGALPYRNHGDPA